MKKEFVKNPIASPNIRVQKLKITHENSLTDVRNESPKKSQKKVVQKTAKYQIFNFSNTTEIKPAHIKAKTLFDSPEIDKEISSFEDYNNLLNNHSQKSSAESINSNTRKKGLSWKNEKFIDDLTRSCSHYSLKEEKFSFLPQINMKMSLQKNFKLKTKSSLCLVSVDECKILPKIQKMSKFKSDKR